MCTCKKNDAAEKNIRNLISNTAYILAPMAGFTDSPFRMICREFGCGLAFTEMISVRALAFGSRKTMDMLGICRGDSPLILQLFDKDADYIERALERVAPDSYSMIDFNAACPMKKIVNNGAGAALLDDHPRLGKILKELVRLSPVPVSVKIRTGMQEGMENAYDTVKLARDCGVSAVFVHGRTRSRFYRGEVDYELIRELARAMEIPVVASGNIFSPVHARRVRDLTGSAAVLVARGALGRPWIFEDCAGKTAGGVRRDPLFVAGVMERHFSLMESFYGEKRASFIFRKHFSLYIRSFPGVKHLKAEAFRTGGSEEFRGLFRRFAETAEGEAGYAAG